MEIRKEFTGMLPAAIEKFEQLIEASAALIPRIVRGYDCNVGKDSYFSWGCAATISSNDEQKLRKAAEKLGITWLADDGSMAYTAGLTIDDFKTYRVDGALQLTPEKEV